MTAYADSLVMESMEALGEMADCAVDLFGYPLDLFWEVFAASAVAREVGGGSPFAIVGKTGVELAIEVCDQGGLAIPGDLRRLCQKPLLSLSRAYWCGWILAFYQWHSGRSFSEVNRGLPISTVQNMYATYHEQSEERFAEAADEIIASSSAPCGLRRQRAIAGLSQSQLAAKSGVGLRAIQQYEQGSKSIARASYENVERLARALYCRPQDLMPTVPRFEYAVVALPDA